MFYERLQLLCKENGITATALLKELKLSTSKLTAWKNGSVPNLDVATMIANHFNVSLDYLVGRTDNPRLHIQEVETSEGTADLRVSKPLTDEEIVLFREMLEKMGREK